MSIVIPPNQLSRVATGFDSVSAGIGKASSAGGDAAVQDGLQSFQFASSMDNILADGSAHIADGSVFPSPGPFFEKTQEFRSGKFNPSDHQFEDVSHHLHDLSFDITDGLGAFSQNLFGGGGLAKKLSDVMLNPQPLPPGPPDPDSIRSSVIGKVADDLNPQPLPPGPPSDRDGLHIDLRDLFAAVALNPQPLPPGPPDPGATPLYLTDLLSEVDRFAEDDLNPQPLPPGPQGSEMSKVAEDLNPQPLPPGPPSSSFIGTLANFGTMDDLLGQARSLDASSQQTQFFEGAFALQFNRLQSMQSVLDQTSSLMQDVQRQTSKTRL